MELPATGPPRPRRRDRLHTVATAPAHLNAHMLARLPVIVARTRAGVKMRAVASLVAYERDPRTHSAEKRSWSRASRSFYEPRLFMRPTHPCYQTTVRQHFRNTV